MTLKNRVRRLIVLGAGASYAVGLPDGDRILPHLTLYANGPILPIRNRTPMDLFSNITPALLRYAVNTGFRKGDRFPLDTVIEQFYQAARQDAAGISNLTMLWHAICEFIYSRSCERAEAYTPFVQTLDDHDVVISFNWDVCLEIARHRLGRPVALSWTKRPEKAPWVLKPHGSVDFITAGAGPVPDVGPRDECLEEIHPHLPPVITSTGRLAPGLARIRTYDLAWEVEANWNQGKLSLTVDVHSQTPRNTASADVGPLHVARFFPDAGPFILTPGGAPILYDWSYSQIQRAITEVAQEIAGIWVIGYSFPRYDAGVHDLLRGVARSIGDVPVHIVNPSASSLPQDVLRNIFGDVALHPVGFLEYEWPG